MDAAVELGRNPRSKHKIQPEYGDKQADAGRDLPESLAGMHIKSIRPRCISRDMSMPRHNYIGHQGNDWYHPRVSTTVIVWVVSRKDDFFIHCDSPHPPPHHPRKSSVTNTRKI